MEMLKGLENKTLGVKVQYGDRDLSIFFSLTPVQCVVVKNTSLSKVSLKGYTPTTVPLARESSFYHSVAPHWVLCISH